LAKIDLEQIQHHPDRGKLALFGAAARIQKNQFFDAKKYLSYAKSQGCSPNLVKTVLLAGTHFSMRTANVLLGQENKSRYHDSELEGIGFLKLTGKSHLIHSHKRSETAPLLDTIDHNCHIEISKQFDSFGKNPQNAEIYQHLFLGNWEFLTRLDDSRLPWDEHVVLKSLIAMIGYQQSENLDGLKRCRELAKMKGASSHLTTIFLHSGILNTKGILAILSRDYNNAYNYFNQSLKIFIQTPSRDQILSRLSTQIQLFEIGNAEEIIKKYK